MCVCVCVEANTYVCKCHNVWLSLRNNTLGDSHFSEIIKERKTEKALAKNRLCWPWGLSWSHWGPYHISLTCAQHTSYKRTPSPEHNPVRLLPPVHLEDRTWEVADRRPRDASYIRTHRGRTWMGTCVINAVDDAPQAWSEYGQNKDDIISHFIVHIWR